MEAPGPVPRRHDPEREAAELRARLAGLQAADCCSGRLLQHAALKHNVAVAQGELQARVLQRKAGQVGGCCAGGRRVGGAACCRSSAADAQDSPLSPCIAPCSLQRDRALGLAAAHAVLDLAKNRVDLHRWRQRTALLKVRLSSAAEDVERYRRLGAGRGAGRTAGGAAACAGGGGGARRRGDGAAGSHDGQQ